MTVTFKTIIGMGILAFLVASPGLGLTADKAVALPTRTVAVGDKFSVELEANPSTGYTWKCSVDEEHLKLLSQAFRRKEGVPKGMVGAGGHAIFEFMALKPGKASISFSYGRPWEQEVIQQRTMTVFIRAD